MRRQEESGGDSEENQYVGRGTRGNPPRPKTWRRSGGCSRQSFTFTRRIAVPGYSAHWCQKPVSSPRDGLHKRGVLRRIPQGVPQTPDRCIQAMVEIDIGVRWPEPVAQLLPRDDLPRPFQKFGQHLKRLLLQLDLEAAAAQFS